MKQATMKFEDPDGFRRTPVSAPLPRRGTDAGRRRGQSAVSSLYSAVRPGRSQSRPRQSRAPGLNCGDAISPALAAYAPRARSSSPSSTSRSPLRPGAAAGAPAAARRAVSRYGSPAASLLTSAPSSRQATRTRSGSTGCRAAARSSRSARATNETANVL